MQSTTTKITFTTAEQNIIRTLREAASPAPANTTDATPYYPAPGQLDRTEAKNSLGINIPERKPPVSTVSQLPQAIIERYYKPLDQAIRDLMPQLGLPSPPDSTQLHDLSAALPQPEIECLLALIKPAQETNKLPTYQQCTNYLDKLMTAHQAHFEKQGFPDNQINQHIAILSLFKRHLNHLHQYESEKKSDISPTPNNNIFNGLFDLVMLPYPLSFHQAAVFTPGGNQRNQLLIDTFQALHDLCENKPTKASHKTSELKASHSNDATLQQLLNQVPLLNSFFKKPDNLKQMLKIFNCVDLLQKSMAFIQKIIEAQKKKSLTREILKDFLNQSLVSLKLAHLYIRKLHNPNAAEQRKVLEKLDNAMAIVTHSFVRAKLKQFRRYVSNRTQDFRERLFDNSRNTDPPKQLTEGNDGYILVNCTPGPGTKTITLSEISLDDPAGTPNLMEHDQNSTPLAASAEKTLRSTNLEPPSAAPKNSGSPTPRLEAKSPSSTNSNHPPASPKISSPLTSKPETESNEKKGEMKQKEEAVNFQMKQKITRAISNLTQLNNTELSNKCTTVQNAETNSDLIIALQGLIQQLGEVLKNDMQAQALYNTYSLSGWQTLRDATAMVVRGALFCFTSCCAKPYDFDANPWLQRRVYTRTMLPLQNLKKDLQQSIDYNAENKGVAITPEPTR